MNKIIEYLKNAIGIISIRSIFDNDAHNIVSEEGGCELSKLSKPNFKIHDIAKVRLSCFQEVWQKWCETETSEEFDKWLHDKINET